MTIREIWEKENESLRAEINKQPFYQGKIEFLERDIEKLTAENSKLKRKIKRLSAPVKLRKHVPKAIEELAIGF